MLKGLKAHIFQGSGDPGVLASCDAHAPRAALGRVCATVDPVRMPGKARTASREGKAMRSGRAGASRPATVKAAEGVGMRGERWRSFGCLS